MFLTFLLVFPSAVLNILYYYYWPLVGLALILTDALSLGYGRYTRGEEYEKQLNV